MTYQEIVHKVDKLTFEERISLLAIVAQSLAQPEKEHFAQKSSLPRVLGLLKTEEHPPSPTELEEDYIRYLQEKYQ